MLPGRSHDFTPSPVHSNLHWFASLSWEPENNVPISLNTRVKGNKFSHSLKINQPTKPDFKRGGSSKKTESHKFNSSKQQNHLLRGNEHQWWWSLFSSKYLVLKRIKIPKTQLETSGVQKRKVCKTTGLSLPPCRKIHVCPHAYTTEERPTESLQIKEHESLLKICPNNSFWWSSITLWEMFLSHVPGTFGHHLKMLFIIVWNIFPFVQWHPSGVLRWSLKFWWKRRPPGKSTDEVQNCLLNQLGLS